MWEIRARNPRVLNSYPASFTRLDNTLGLGRSVLLRCLLYLERIAQLLQHRIADTSLSPISRTA